ncbi:MGS-like domain protein, partial [Fusobacterium equinum]
GPEMRSTGEVLGVGNNVAEAVFKGLLAAKRVHQIKDRNILVTIRDKDKEEFLPIAKDLVRYGSKLYATAGTQKYLSEHGVEATAVRKISEDSPNLLDFIKNRQVDLLINTPTKANDSQRDGFKIRRSAIEYGVEVLTSLDTMKAIIKMQDRNLKEETLDVFDISKI